MSKESRKRQGFGEKDNGGYEWTSRKDPIMMGGHDVSHPRETVKYPCPQRSNPDHWHPSEIRAAPYEQPNNRLKPVHSRTRPAGPDLLPRPLLPDLNFDTSPRTGLSTATASSSSSRLPGLRESSFMHSETELYRSSVDHLPAFYRHQSNIYPDDRPIDRGAHLFRSHNVGDRRMTSGELASDSLPRRSSASPAKHIHLDGDRQPLQNRRSASPRPHPFSYQPYRDYDSAGRPGGSVGAFFTRRPGVERPEQPSVPLKSRSFEDNRYPTLPPPSAGGTGPDRHSSAWFAPARPQRPRDMHNWLPDHIRAYETGYEDAIRSVENGVFGVHGIHYRHPLLVQREIPPDSASGPRHFDVDDVGAQRFPGPLQHAARGTHPYSDITPYRPDYHGSPYDRHYAKDPGHREYFARHDLPRDSYHSRAQALYPYTQPPYAVHPPRSQRQLISCYPCRTRKLKCDGQKPCAQCSRRGSEAECAYATHVRRRGKGKRADGEDSSGESTVGRNNAGSDIETPRSFLGRSLSDFHEESMPIKPKEEKDTQSSPPPDIELDEKKEDMVDGD